MGRYDFDWHQDVYRKAIRDIAAIASSGPCTGWLAWFREHHPEQAQKYDEAIKRIHSLWGDLTSAAMDDFKAAVKMEVDAARWAIEKYRQSDECTQMTESLQPAPLQTECPVRVVIEVTTTEKLVPDGSAL